ncbi:choice-of-anchor tandem repeat NxxGxxAF-containing protein [Oscillatoria sp. HE19RPO]|uniref:choice-of-anchor tandem repeat NxxGxxAF-containing protein n=1 Tax=Oscillatoria sp. HE19RPO TaxID=2954806 RepID=UPI0020C38947|nr:choice-of-anchor tandem repeat NxxGxxAF-containing protein [Oscillatoria sp. HE19RPO]
MKKPYQILSVAAIALSTSAIASEPVQAYTFIRIADSSEQNGFSFGSNYSSFGQGFSTSWSHTNWNWSATHDPASPYKGLAINNSGQVAFFASLKNPAGVTGLFVNSNGQNKTIATTLNDFKSLGQGLSLNENGEVAFFAEFNTGGSGILLGNPTTTNYQTIADTNGIFSSIAPGVSLNDNQEVAFFAALDAGGQEIFKSNGTTTTQITHCSGSTVSGSECPIQSQRPSLNNQGEVAFTGINGVFTSQDGQTINNIMSDPATFATGRYHDASINNSGRVLYRTGLNTWWNSAAILSSTIDRTSIISGNTAPFHSVSRSPAMNNDSEVAFIAEKGWNFGIYTGHSLQDKVIAVGDELFGSKVKALSIDRESINDNCQIAFWASLESGIEGIYRANPGKGQCQTNPLMPDATHDPGEDGRLYSFINAPGRRWYDPPSATGFRYQMTGDSLFTEILNVPNGFDNPFTIAVGETILGEFLPGDKIDFVSLFGKGVSEFTVTGINVDPTNPAVFPIKLDFNTTTASFDMYAIGYKNSAEKVPEPTSVLSLLALGTAGAIATLKRKARSLDSSS